jgi:DNA-binding LytR/AlgR family response regulator
LPAYALVEHGDHLDGAVLDIKVRDNMVFPVADALRARGVPFVFVTGYDQQAIPDRYSDVAHYQKPLNPAQLVRALFSKAGQIP